MFKKILASMLMLVSLTAWSSERISIVWGFNPASNQANFYRAIANELNTMQNKYEFVFENRPGAGGAIAARYVLSNPDNTILGGTSTFFLRSQFDPQTGYSTGEFQPVLVQTQGAPLVLLSKKHHSLKDATKQTTDITVSVSGFGSSSHLVASVLKEAIPATKIVNYVSLVDANKDIMGQHIDAGWNFLADVDKLIESKSAQGLAITGTKSQVGIPTFKDLGIAGFDNLTSNTGLYASAKMQQNKVQEIHKYLREVNRQKKIADFYAREYSQPADMNYEQTSQWYVQQEVFWTVQSRKIKPF
jgi:tripartite-type tricarboxylate transporter receptor subunit TctC